MHRDRETRQRDREAEGQIMEVVRRVAWVDGHWRNCEARDAFPSSTRRLRGSEAWKPRSWNRDARDAFPSSTRRPGGSEAWKLRPWNREARDAFPSSTRRLRGSEAWKQMLCRLKRALGSCILASLLMNLQNLQLEPQNTPTWLQKAPSKASNPCVQARRMGRSLFSRGWKGFQIGWLRGGWGFGSWTYMGPT